ncbi:hypothetical protein LXL04_037112 [Taraxacum kok-saghyz]
MRDQSANSTSQENSNLQGNLRDVKVPITAVKMMLLEVPGHLRSTFRLSALRADNLLTNGKLYMLIPAGIGIGDVTIRMQEHAKYHKAGETTTQLQGIATE